MSAERVVIVGAGHGGFQLAASLRQGGFDGTITLLGEEPVLPYQRPPLSKDYLDGKIGLDLLLMRPDAFYRDHRIDYLAGTRAAEIDRGAKRLRLASGEQLDYDHLVLATGARNRVPPMPGIERSINTMSGETLTAMSIASSPSDASPTTSMSPSCERNVESPLRTTG